MTDGETLSKYCKRKKINYSCVVYRIELGWTLENAVKEAFKISKRPNKKARAIHFIGKKPFIDWCRERGINYFTIYGRARKLGLTPVEYVIKMFDNQPYKAYNKKRRVKC